MFKSGKETKALLLLGCYKIGFALLCVGLLFASADQGWFNESQFERVFQKWPLEGEAAGVPRHRRLEWMVEDEVAQAK